jgi:hypothetical protein
MGTLMAPIRNDGRSLNLSKCFSIVHGEYQKVGEVRKMSILFSCSLVLRHAKPGDSPVAADASAQFDSPLDAC